MSGRADAATRWEVVVTVGIWAVLTLLACAFVLLAVELVQRHRARHHNGGRKRRSRIVLRPGRSPRRKR